MPALQRYCDQATAFSVPATATGQGFSFGSFSSGEVRVPAGSSITSLTWYSGDTLSGPWYVCTDVAAVNVAASQAAAIPPGCFGAKFLLPVGNAAGTINLDFKG